VCGLSGTHPLQLCRLAPSCKDALCYEGVGLREQRGCEAGTPGSARQGDRRGGLGPFRIDRAAPRKVLELKTEELTQGLKEAVFLKVLASLEAHQDGTNCWLVRVLGPDGIQPDNSSITQTSPKKHLAS
jgi:hypothetical protein